ncbi:hypothetical protein [Paenibacillus sp. MBLB4367]|uniref:hypothetical protein n=1 Tax=Paenibacillus sp. MBLB4367 TaxID=3384767 RepID=UPI00390800FC
MGFLGAMIVIAAIVIVIYLVSQSSKGSSPKRPRGGTSRRRVDYGAISLPLTLGIRPHIPLDDLERRLNKALSPAFQEKLKMRHLQARPGMSDAEYEWKLFELKRYFVMCAVMRNVPMFSAAVDDIWHDMLMFTREYQRFCDEWIGTTIHHAPHTNVQPMPGERAWFDWVYSQLFEPTPFSGSIWNAFFRNPLPKPLLEQLRHDSREQLMDKLFNREAASKYEEIKETIEQLIDSTKEHVQRAYDQSPDNGYDHNQSDTRDREQDRGSFGATDAMMVMAGSMLLYSMLDQTLFEDRMQAQAEEIQEQAEEEDQRNGGDSGGAACGYSDSSYNSDSDSSDGGGGGDSGGSDGGGGSSCSSSSCGSGCGGGGD